MKNKFEALMEFQSWSNDSQLLCQEWSLSTAEKTQVATPLVSMRVIAKKTKKVASRKRWDEDEQRMIEAFAETRMSPNDIFAMYKKQGGKRTSGSVLSRIGEIRSAKGDLGL